jgi:hypothetical protein
MSALHRVGDLWIRFRLRKSDLFGIDVREALIRGGGAVAFLPDDPMLVPEALGVCEKLAGWLKPFHIFWMGPAEQNPGFGDTGPAVTAMVIPKANTVWGLPYRPLVEHIRKLPVMVAIDLNPSFRLPSAYLCCESGASLRIGLRAKPGYFNFQYSWTDGGEDAMAEHYASLLRVLADLRGDPA